MDGRRRQWVPIATDLPWTRTGHNLQKRFGPMGLLVWILVLCAAKKGFNQGEFDYVTEAEGWHKLGIENPPKHFTLKEFFAYTGRMKQTKVNVQRAKRGQKVIEIQAWSEWNARVERQMRNEQKARKRGRSTGDNTVGMSPPDLDLDLDSDREEILRTTTPEELEKNAAEARRLMAELTRKVKTP